MGTYILLHRSTFTATSKPSQKSLTHFRINLEYEPDDYDDGFGFGGSVKQRVWCGALMIIIW